ncbi:MAG: 4Fe-4S binding protein [Candidatus Bathyarchaeota archaeon]|nr:4Fe-4S binding protein [Candidatus Bathyarchaeota archaeon]
MTPNGVETVQCVYFSPTGTTRRTVETIAEGTGLRIADPIDVTLPASREEWDGSTQGAILVVGVPVYAGTLPSHTLDPLHRLEGNGRWAVPVAVYGMRSAEDTIEQLSGLLRTRGFKILAAANFVAEHSYSHDKLPLGLGRPDKRDLEIAREFGGKIAEKLESHPDELPLESRPLKYGENYRRKREDWPENRRWGSSTRVSDYDEKKCIKCNICVESCPSGAIDPETYAIDEANCIRCFACTRVCPAGVRQTRLSARAMTFFTDLLDAKKEPETFI